jgi:hypothetical protein
VGNPTFQPAEGTPKELPALPDFGDFPPLELLVSLAFNDAFAETAEIVESAETLGREDPVASKDDAFPLEVVPPEPGVSEPGDIELPAD